MSIFQDQFININLQGGWLLIRKMMEIDWIWIWNGLRLLVEGKGLGIGVMGHESREGFVTLRRTEACVLVDDCALLVHSWYRRRK